MSTPSHASVAKARSIMAQWSCCDKETSEELINLIATALDEQVEAALSQEQANSASLFASLEDSTKQVLALQASLAAKEAELARVQACVRDYPGHHDEATYNAWLNRRDEVLHGHH